MKRGEQTKQMRTKKLNKNKRIFLAVEQRRYQFKHTCTKKVNILNHTHKHTHANIVIHAHKTLFTEKWHRTFINEGKNYKCEVHVTKDKS